MGRFPTARNPLGRQVYKKRDAAEESLWLQLRNEDSRNSALTRKPDKTISIFKGSCTWIHPRKIPARAFSLSGLERIPLDSQGWEGVQDWKATALCGLMCFSKWVLIWLVTFCEALNRHSPRGVLGLEETWLRRMSQSNSLMFHCNWELQWSGPCKVTWMASGRAGVTEIKPWDWTKGSYPTMMPWVWQRTPSFLVFALESWLSKLKGVKESELRAGGCNRAGGSHVGNGAVGRAGGLLFSMSVKFCCVGLLGSWGALHLSPHWAVMWGRLAVPPPGVLSALPWELFWSCSSKCAGLWQLNLKLSGTLGASGWICPSFKIRWYELGIKTRILKTKAMIFKAYQFLIILLHFPIIYIIEVIYVNIVPVQWRHVGSSKLSMVGKYYKSRLFSSLRVSYKTCISTLCSYLM